MEPVDIALYDMNLETGWKVHDLVYFLSAMGRLMYGDLNSCEFGATASSNALGVSSMRFSFDFSFGFLEQTSISLFFCFPTSPMFKFCSICAKWKLKSMFEVCSEREIKIDVPIFTQILPLEIGLLELRCLFKECDIKTYKYSFCGWTVTFVAFLIGWISNEYTFNYTRI